LFSCRAFFLRLIYSTPMIRRRLNPDHGGEREFRWRAAEVTRLEGFSDAVFAFAVTLLVVSLEVPKTYPELLQAMRGFFAFGACFAVLANIWHQHCRFFRRYGLQDPVAVTLNCCLLFCVLFYVYPMKFMFTSTFTQELDISEAQVRTLFLIFSGGYVAIFSIFTLLYWHAWRKRGELALTPLECLITRHSVIHQAAMVIIGLVSILLAQTLPAQLIGLAGYWYFVILPYFTISERIFDKQKRNLLAAEGLQ
jgi:uncharacterized membrane protein